MSGNNELDFLKQLNVSERTRDNYLRAAKSPFLKGILSECCGVHNLFEINDIMKLWEIYSIVNIHPKNVNSHRNYSAAIMKYIRYLNNGQKYGRRRDSGKDKPKRCGV